MSRRAVKHNHQVKYGYTNRKIEIQTVETVSVIIDRIIAFCFIRYLAFLLRTKYYIRQY